MEITVEKLPTTIEEFIAVRDTIATSPEGGAVVMALALSLLGQNETLGLAALTVALDKSRLISGATYKGFSVNNVDASFIKQQVGNHPYIGNSYVVGTSVSNSYALPSGPLRFLLTDNPNSGDKSTGRYKIFVASTGADSARPITLASNDKGIWKAIEWSSLLSGIRAPQKPDGDDL